MHFDLLKLSRRNQADPDLFIVMGLRRSRDQELPIKVRMDVQNRSW